MIADRILATRAETWQETVEDEDGEQVLARRCMGIAHLGGATLDIEENYLLKKLYSAPGVVQVENQARI
jgi:formate dehydrogenase major subunit